MDINYAVRFFKVFRIMYKEIVYFRQLTVMSVRIYSGSLCIYTDFIIVYIDKEITSSLGSRLPVKE